MPTSDGHARWLHAPATPLSPPAGSPSFRWQTAKHGPLGVAAAVLSCTLSAAGAPSSANLERTYLIGKASSPRAQRFDSLDQFNAAVPCVRPGDKVLLEQGKTFHGVLNLRACADADDSERLIEVRSFDPRAPMSALAVRSPAVVDSAVEARSLGLEWRPVDRRQRPSGLPESDRDLSVFSMGPLSGEVAEVFHGSSRLLLARAPSAAADGQYFPMADVAGRGETCPSAVCMRSLDTAAASAARAVAQVESQRDTAFAVVRTSPWSLAASTIEGIDPASGALRLNDAIAGSGMPAPAIPRAGFGYILVNSIALLDSPGEWYFDRSTRMLYLGWRATDVAPTSAATTLSFASSADAEQFAHGDAGLSFMGSDSRSTYRYRVKISNLRLVHAVGHGIRIQRAPGVEIADVRVDQSGRSGIAVSNARLGARISRSTVTGAADNGILVSSADSVEIVGNTITNAGHLANQRQYGMDFNGVRAGGFSRFVATDNQVSGAGYAGVMLSEPEARDPRALRIAVDVSRNVISRFCTLLNDCGAIYINGRQNGAPQAVDQPSSAKRIQGNIISSPAGNLDGLPGPSAAGSAPKSRSGAYVRMVGAIYLDHSASGYDISGNQVSGTYEPYGWRIFNKGVLNGCSRKDVEACIVSNGGYKCYTPALDRCNEVVPPR